MPFRKAPAACIAKVAILHGGTVCAANFDSEKTHNHNRADGGSPALNFRLTVIGLWSYSLVTGQVGRVNGSLVEDIMPPLAWTLEKVSPKHSLIPQRRILLVDKDAPDRERYARPLRERGLSVRVCSSYEEGERYLERESYGMVIVDQGGPAFEGKVIAARSMMKDRMVPVLVITRHHDMASYIEAMQLGAADYLEKPIPLNDFLTTIDTHLPSGWAKAKLAS